VAMEYPAAPDDPFYKMTVGLPTVDKVELVFVTPLSKDQASGAQPKTVEIEGAFSGVPGAQFQIASQNILRDDAAEDFASLWRKILHGPGAGCFAPAYSIRFWAKDQMLLVTNVCYHCHNITIPENGSVEIRGFNAEGKSGKELLKRLKELLPKSDTDRNHR